MPSRLFPRLIQLVLPALSAALTACASGPGAAPGGLDGPLMIGRQGSFFVGGRDMQSSTLSLLPAYPASGTVTVEQMYVRFQEPVNPSRVPLVLVHGCCLTGKTWETTPDGRMGWDELFVRRGHPTYVVDQVSRGRSAANVTAIVAAKGGQGAPGQLPQVFSASQEGAWAIFRFGPSHPRLFPGMQFPVEAAPELYKQMVPDWLNALPTPNPTAARLGELARRLNGAVLVSHSQSGIYPFQTVQQDRQGVRGIVSIEPGACPAADSDMRPYAGLPILVLWGDFVNESPRWAPRLKACRDFVAAANAAGAKAELVMLSEVGFPGASHMLMQDRHSLGIGNWLSGWIASRVAV